MVSNQTEFDKEYQNKQELKEIEIVYEEFEEQSLIIENYSELEKLELRENNSINKITLSNLTKLQEVTIWDCGTKDLLIENCPQIKKLIIRQNNLTNLNFLLNLDNLTELDLYGNNELIELLKPYNGDWKTWKEVQKVAQSFQQNPQLLAKELNNLRIENKKLVELKNKQSITPNNSEEVEKKYRELKKFLHSLTSEEQLKSKEIEILKTSEIKTNVSAKLNDQKRNLSELQETIEEYKEKIAIYEKDKNRILKKEEELSKLKKDIKNSKKIEDDDYLEELLEAQQENNQKWLARVKKRLLSKQITEQEINNLCQLQKKLVQLKSNIHQQEQQINQIINYSGTFHAPIFNSSVTTGNNTTFGNIEKQNIYQAHQSIQPPK